MTYRVVCFGLLCTHTVPHSRRARKRTFIASVLVPVSFPERPHRRPAGLGLLAILAVMFAQSARPSGQRAAGGDNAESNDAIARLGRRLEAGAATLQYGDEGGYLPSLLQLLGIKVDSQVLVFSKTSFQHALIS